MEVIDYDNMAYKCGYCGLLFKKLSACASHIERSAVLKMAFPADITVVDKTKDKGFFAMESGGRGVQTEPHFPTRKERQ